MMFAPLNMQRVGAVLALDGVAAVAGVPDEGVVAGAEEATSLPRPPLTMSLPSPPISVSSPRLPMMRVVAGAAVDGQLDHVGGQAGGVERVVAAEAVDDELVVGALGAGDVHGGRQAGRRRSWIPPPAIWTLSARVRCR